MSAPLVSVVLVTKDGSATLPAVLDAIERQRVDFDVEIVAVDSGSTDGTLDLLASRVRELVRIQPAAFNHGLTRNLGIEHSRGELAVLLVQDAEPASDTWLTALTAPLRADPRVAGSFARQRPRADATALTRRALDGWVATRESGRTSALASRRDLDALSPMDRLLTCAFDNVCSCLRRSVWIDHPFRATPIAEDLEWARDVLLAGCHLVYAPEAVVVHSHDRSARYEFARTRVLHQRLFQLFGLQTIPSLSHLVRAIGSTVPAHLWCERGAPTRLPRALALAIAWPLGQYLGARSGQSSGGVTSGGSPP